MQRICRRKVQYLTQVKRLEVNKNYKSEQGKVSNSISKAVIRAHYLIAKLLIKEFCTVQKCFHVDSSVLK